MLRSFARALAVVCLAATPLTSSAAQPAVPQPAPQAAGKKAESRQPARAPAKQPPAKAEPAAGKMSAETFSGLEWRGIGPAVTSGRVLDIAVDPRHKSTWILATVGGVWRTENAGTSWTPVTDHDGSFSIGCVTIDPSNPLTVWVGSGENNSQRSVSYGDGVYKSTDGGRTFKNVGLKESYHIGKIVVDPRHAGTVYVAAMGNLWAPGGDRGVYKTTDGGATWKRVLEISDNTGVSDLAIDPRDPDVLYAAAYQRRRHVWTLIDGGPESALYKTTDGGATWTKLESGLPTVDMGRIGIALAPSNPDMLYAVVEAAGDAGGFFRSTDRGATFSKRSKYVPGGPQYYNELVVDPADADRVYSMDVYMQVTDDGGKTFHNAGERWKHVDNHALWIDPDDSDHLINGDDGGVYESRDRAGTWQFKANLPISQFYRVDVDNSKPFYYVYGGTQDNTSVGGPSRTTTDHGGTNEMWFVTTGGDGFVSRVDPQEPNIVYAESQNAGIVRFDRRTGEQVDIQPQPGPGDAPLRWNWDSPIVISPHAHTRLYVAAQRVFRSDDRGNTWKPVSPDLTRQIDRNRLKVMGRIWSVDAIAKNTSTSFYGNIVSLAESPVKEGLLYVGTDDGLVQVSEDGGATWRKVERFAGVPDGTYVSRLQPSPRDADVVYAAFDNHKNGDFKPYLLKSADRGRTWTSIASDLPARGSVYAVVEDPVTPSLLYAGTEFGAFFSPDGGARWVRFNLPTIPVRDMAIQTRENDLVVATFGRGFYVLDDLTPLRRATPTVLEAPATLFPVRTALMYIPSQPLGLRGKAFMGESFFTAPNPPFGAVFTYYLKDAIKTRAKAREDAEKTLEKDGKDVLYPSWDELRAEDREQPPAIVLTVADAAGNVVRRIEGPVTAGFHRVSWDLRYPPSEPANTPMPDPDNLFADPPRGPLAAAGTYTVSLATRIDGKVTPVGEPQTFQATTLGGATLPDPNPAATHAFEQQVARLQGAVLGAGEVVDESLKHLALVRKAIAATPKADPSLLDEVSALEGRLKDIKEALEGDSTVGNRSEPTPPGIADRVQRIVYGQWTVTSAPTETQREAYRIASEAFGPVLARLRTLVDTDMKALDARLDAAGAPWTPGRVPVWKPEGR